MAENKEPHLELGDIVKVKTFPRGTHVSPFKVVGITVGGSRVFLQPSAFLNQSRSLHAVVWDSEDLVRSDR